MQKLAGVMASSGYHVILPDIPGQGTTERDERRKYSVDAQARFLKRLLVWGKKDGILPVDLAPVWHRQIRASRLIRLENFGHMPQDEDPELFLDQIRSFLKSGFADT